jgi:protein-tyrosine phosphatase
MVDIHSHVLWGLDDGPETYQESLAMLRTAADAGTTDIVATPHSNRQYTFDPQQIEAKIAQLEASGEPLPRIHRGCDFHLNFVNVQEALADPAKFTINHRNYLLVEFPEIGIPAGIDGVFSQFLDRGIIPVLTHPERNEVLMQNPAQLARWVAKHCLIQVTALSLLGRFGGKALEHAWALIGRGLVHVVASDAHDPVRRHPRLAEARAEVARRSGENNAERLFELNPRAIVEGRDVTGIVPTVKARRRWFSFGRR